MLTSSNSSAILQCSTVNSKSCHKKQKHFATKIYKAPLQRGPKKPIVSTFPAMWDATIGQREACASKGALAVARLGRTSSFNKFGWPSTAWAAITGSLEGFPGQLAKKVIFGFQKHKSVRKQAVTIKIRKRCILHQLHIISSPYCSHVSYIHLHHLHIVSIFIQQEKKQQHDSPF